MGSSRGRKDSRIFLSAGEASGDLHGSFLANALRSQNPGIHISCLGGANLRSSGAEVIVDNRELAVVGGSEVLRQIRQIYSGWQTIRRHLLARRPEVLVLIDFPDFNLLLARVARRVGIKVLYYISPQVWAWRSGRVRTLKRLSDAVAVILPFEAPYYERHGMKVHFVGHPLLDVLASAPSREEAAHRYRENVKGPIVGILPGSRRSEIHSMLGVLLEAASLIRERHRDVSFLLPLAPTLDSGAIAAQAGRWGLPVQIVTGDTYGAIRACDLLLAVSGTVTLEAAILGTPMIVVYKMSMLSYRIARALIHVPYVAMPNVIAGRQIVPELLQDGATPGRIAGEALDLLQEPERLEQQRRDLSTVAENLGQPGVAQRVARLVLELMAQ